MKYQINEVSNHIEYMQEYQINSLLAKAMVYKQYTDAQIKSFFKKDFIYHDFSLFQEGEMALERIQEAIDSDEKICIYGDYDCDGILATSILVDVFKQLNKDVGYYIPDRFMDGYGLNATRVQQMYDKGYTLIITVDNGVKAYEAIELANTLGVDVIVTDHHSFDEDIVDAYCIVHTKLSPDYPFKEISGGFIAYKLACAMLGKHDKYLYGLAAITTISDMMPLVDENRAVVKYGLHFLKEGKYPQITKLLGTNQEISAQAIGFTIAPKINAFGRLCEIVSPNKLVPYFVRGASDEYLNKIAQDAIKINNKRQSMTTSQYQDVIKGIENDNYLYCYQKEIHEGLIGLVAGKYTREYHKPSFVMTYNENLEVYKGSARSIIELPLLDIFKSVDEYLEGYGGHALAGGFSVTKDNVNKLQEALSNHIDKALEDLPVIEIPVLKIALDDLTIPAVKSLALLEPFGNGHEPILFYLENLVVNSAMSLKDGKHIKFQAVLNGVNIDVLYFNVSEPIEELLQLKSINVVGELSTQTFMNKESINIKLTELI